MKKPKQAPPTIGLFQRQKSTYKSEETYEGHLLEQYKLAVSLANEVSSRRMHGNSFFVTIHTAIVGAVAILAKESYLTASYWLIAPIFAVLVLCLLWWQIIDSYKKLNSQKFKIIGELEKHLPLSILGAEWVALGQGNDLSKYNPLSHIERAVPVAFALIYIAMSFAIFTTPTPPVMP